MKNIVIGNKNFDLVNNKYIMGILNVTPDSLSDGGNYNLMDNAMAHVEQMIKDGAAIIDIGGESTRPNYTMISDSEEIERVCPIIEKIKNNFDIPVSLDTYKYKVAKAGIVSGADLINDIWGLKWDNNMASVVAKNNVAVCVMHNRKEINYINFLEDVISDLQESLDIAEKAGISKDKIILDPGVGFAKTLEMNLSITNNVDLLHQLGCSVLLGTSRKSMIGLTLDLPVNKREEGTIATTVIGAMRGVQFFRVHNVLGNKRALDMAQAILKAR